MLHGVFYGTWHCPMVCTVYPMVCPCTSREANERQGGLIRTCSRPCAFEAEKTKKKNTKPYQLVKTHHEINPQQPGYRDHLERACDETRPKR